MLIHICEPKSDEDFAKYYDLRWNILRKPWNQPRGSERDDMEDRSIHIMACDKYNKVIGVGRLHFNTLHEAQIRYMAVDDCYRGKGIGSLILKELENRALKKGAKYIVLNSRESAIDFYKKHGYFVVGKSHMLFGVISHLKMMKSLNKD